MTPRVIIIQECADCPLCKTIMPPGRRKKEITYRCSKTGAPVILESRPEYCPLEPFSPDTWRRHAESECRIEQSIEQRKEAEQRALLFEKPRDVADLEVKVMAFEEKITERFNDLEKKMKAKVPGLLKSPGGSVLDQVMKKGGG